MKVNPRTGAQVVRIVLQAAGTRPEPTAAQGEKTTYAVKFADQMAREIAQDLAALLPRIEATTKRNAPSSRGPKQLDVNFSTPRLGLALGMSLKSVHLRELVSTKTKAADGKAIKIPGRYTHNLKRNDEELALEAASYHERQPYAVMVGVFFLPFDSCTDAKKVNAPSSFGSWVRSLRRRAGRREPEDRPSLFEEIYVALYQPDGSDMQFFDVQSAPPKNKIPSALLSYEQFIDAAYRAYQRRNHSEFEWEDGEVELLSPDADDEE